MAAVTKSNNAAPFWAWRGEVNGVPTWKHYGYDEPTEAQKADAESRFRHRMTGGIAPVPERKQTRAEMRRAKRLVEQQAAMSRKYSKAGISIKNRDFMAAAFPNIGPGQFATTTSFGGDPYKVPREAWAASAWIPGKPVPGVFWGKPQNVYAAVSKFKLGNDGKPHRREEDFVEMCVAMIDDVGTKVPRSKVKLPPSALIETSPANAQAIYFLKSDADSRDVLTCKSLLVALVDSGLTSDGTDPGMKGVTRLWRLPDGVNGKQKYVDLLGHPFKCRLKKYQPEIRYSIAEIVAAYKLDLAAAKARTPTRAGGGKRGKFGGVKVKLRRGEASKRVAEFERMVMKLADHGLYLSSRGLWHEIVCPWLDEHTDKKIGGSALYSPAETNAWLGGYKCHHGHCEHRTIGDIYKFAFHLARGAA